MSRTWAIIKSIDYYATCGAVQPAPKIGHPAKGKIWLSVNGTERQKGDLTELIWSVPEIIWQLSQQVSLGAGDIIMTGTPAGVAALSPGDRIECGVDGIGTLKVSIGKAAEIALCPRRGAARSSSRSGARPRRGRP